MDTPTTPVATKSGATGGADALRDVILQKLTYDLGKSRMGARDRDWFIATALARSVESAPLAPIPMSSVAAAAACAVMYRNAS